MQTINAVLNALGLRSLLSLGDRAAGTTQIVGINRVYDYFKHLFTDIVFDTIQPDGKLGQYAIRFNANSDKGNSSVFVVLVNGNWFALVRQWRPSLGEFTIEVPRGFSNIGDTSNEITLRRELTEEVLNHGVINQITHLKDFAEQNGTHNVISMAYLVEVTVPNELLPSLRGSEAGIIVQLWNREEIETALDLGGQIADNHSLTTLLLALRYIDHRSTSLRT